MATPKLSKANFRSGSLPIFGGPENQTKTNGMGNLECFRSGADKSGAAGLEEAR